MKIKTYFAEYNDYITSLYLDKSPHTIELYARSIGKFIEFLNINSLEELNAVTPNQCRNFQAHLKEIGLSNSSINSNTRPIKAFYNFLITNEFSTNNPFTKVKELKEPKKVGDYLSIEETDAMIAACKDNKELLMFSMMVGLGLRRNEVSTLKISDIVGKHVIVNGKGSKQRKLAIPEDIYDLYLEYLEERNDKYKNIPYDNLFISQERVPFSGEGIRLKIRSLAQRAGLPPERVEQIHPHLCRHSFATNLTASGADIRVIQGALGHSSLATTAKVYSHLRNGTLDQAILNQRSLLKG